MDITHKCINCKTESSYSRKYDSYFCSHCDIWLDNQCDDETCEYCSCRPEKPSLDSEK